MQPTPDDTAGTGVRGRGSRWYTGLLPGGVLALPMVVVSIDGTGTAAEYQGWGPTPASAYVLAIVAAVALIGWRIASLATFAVVGVATVAYLAAGFAFGPILITLVVAAFGFAWQRPVRSVVAWSAGLTVALAVAVVIRVHVVESGEWVDYPRVIGWIVAPLAVGIAVQVRRRSASEIRDARARRAATEERLRMAQDLHDTVGHGLAAIAMQAGVALHVLERDPAKVRESLEAIQATSRDALDGLRGELAALTDEGHAENPAPRRPTPTLADLGVLVDRVGAGGVRVETDVRNVDSLPASVDGTAFRIVQESLTNVLRHADAEVARVTIDVADETLTVTVDDDGSGVKAVVDGHTGDESAVVMSTGARHGDGGVSGRGIPGMRDRATAHGGTLTTGPGPEGGFRVRAMLPVGNDERRQAASGAVS